MKKNTENNTKKDEKYVTILGINMLSTTTSSLLTSIREKIAHNYKFSILTPNPELVLASNKNEDLKKALNSATFAVPDGVGLKFAARFLFNTSLDIIPGRILFDKLIELANKEGWKVFFLGGMGNEAKIASQKLQKTNSKLQIETAGGSEVNVNLSKDVVDKINSFKSDLLFVAFGNPKQEIWIHNNLKYLNVGGAMAVGGTFRYIAGISPLPPKWMGEVGLEWLWRLITEPYRIGRILRAVILFPLRVLWFKLTDV